MDEYMSRVRIWELTCPGLPEEVGRVRRWMRDVLGDSPYAEEAVLVASELGSNALLHSSSGTGLGVFRVSLTCRGASMSVSVTDMGGKGTEPHRERPDANEIHGRGLELAEHLADRLHVDGDNRRGHTVTAEFWNADHNGAECTTRMRGHP